MNISHAGCKRITHHIPILGFKILSADYFEIGRDSKGWVIKLSVSKEDTEIVGWAFSDNNLTELRFEYVPDFKPPAFLCGSLYPVPIENNSLCSLLDLICPGKLDQLEDLIRGFLDQIIFCTKTLFDVNNETLFTTAISYSMAGAGMAIPIND